MAAVVIVGSGAAGLAAALAAADAGADVALLEGAAHVGGTTALSGGVVWAPGNHHLATGPTAVHDAEDALTYLQALARGDVDHDLLAAFTADAGRVAEALEQRGALAWEPLDAWPDYRPELPGGRSGGRSLWPAPLRVRRSVATLVQPSPEDRGVGAAHDDAGGDAAVVLRGAVRGRALVAGLLAAVLDAGVDVRTGARVRSLRRDTEGRVVGVQSAAGDRLDGRVVLATGGFQHDPALAATFLPGAPIAPMGTPGCAGDGLRMALAAGAVLGNMAEGWWMPALQVPGERVAGSAHYRAVHRERAQPGAVLVDRGGRRFADEAQNYGDVGRAMGRFATGDEPWPAAPSWLVVDAANRARYPLGPLGPGDPDPPWLACADDVDALARAIDVDPHALRATIERFNAAAERGEDPDFGRGTFAYDRWIGDPRAPHPTLAPLRRPPFRAVPVHLGCMGTKGGPRTDDRGRVLGVHGPVPGLYAAGNAAASPFGTATAAGGATLGPALVFGTRAGEAAAHDDATGRRCAPVGP